MDSPTAIHRIVQSDTHPQNLVFTSDFQDVPSRAPDRARRSDCPRQASAACAQERYNQTSPPGRHHTRARGSQVSHLAMESADLEVVRPDGDRGRRRHEGNDRGSWDVTAAHLSCLVRICPAALACVRTSCLNEDTASTINFFMPSIESCSSNEKSNF